MVTTSEQNMARPPRIIGYDFSRALAVLGMIIVNFKLVMHASDVGPKWFTWLVSLLEGRAAAMFVVLAGVGLSLLSAQARQSDSVEERDKIRNLLFKRAAFLFVLGLFYSFIWPPDILHFYGLYIAFAGVILYVTDRQLWWWAGGFMILFVVMILLFNYETGWNFDTLEYIDFWTPPGMVRHMVFNGFHPIIPWMTFILIGMWLGRQDVRNVRLQKRLLIGSFLILVMSEWLSMLLIAIFESMMGINEATALFSRDMMPPMPFYLLSAGATAIIVIVLSVMFTGYYRASNWLQPLIATGQLALTIYVAHVLIGMGILEILGWFDGQSLAVAVSYAFIFYSVAVIFAHWWRQHYKRGPLEWMMRQMTG